MAQHTSRVKTKALLLEEAADVRCLLLLLLACDVPRVEQILRWIHVSSIGDILVTCKHNKASGSISGSINAIRAVIDRDSDVRGGRDRN